MDEIDLWIKTILFIVLLAFSAFFSSSEVAIFGLSRRDEEEIKDREDRAANKLKKLLSSPQQTLITILTGNNAVNVAAASLAAILTSDICNYYHIPHTLGIIVEIAVVTGLLLILSEITPKILALRNPLIMALKVAGPISFFRLTLYPIVVFFTAITEFFTRVLGVDKIRLTYSTEELKTLVEISEEKGHLEESEREMISSIFEFGETLVKEIMVPRTDMKMVETDVSLDEIVDAIKKGGFSRYPVFDVNRDNVIGMLYAKDLLPYIQQKSQDFDLPSLMRPAYFVPENKEIAELLREFQKEKVHLAVVVDEYGGTAGIVTLEDILEEIVGEIQDEYDHEKPLFVKHGKDLIIAEAKMTIEAVNDLLEENVISADGDYETLGGFIYDLTGKIPSEEEGIDFGDYKFTIAEVDGQRLMKIRIEKTGVSD